MSESYWMKQMHVKFLSPLGVKGYKAHGPEEIHLPMVYKGVS